MSNSAILKLKNKQNKAWSKIDSIMLDPAKLVSLDYDEWCNRIDAACELSNQYWAKVLKN